MEEQIMLRECVDGFVTWPCSLFDFTSR